MRYRVILILGIFLASYHVNAQSNDGWLITATSKEKYFPPVVANGMIGVLPSSSPLKVTRVLLNGLYDDFGGRNQGVVSSFDLNNSPSIDIKLTQINKSVARAKDADIKDWKQVLDIKKAECVTTYEVYNALSVSHRVMALRHLPYNYLTEITVKALTDETLDFSVAIDDKENLKTKTNSFFYVHEMPMLMKTVTSPTGIHSISIINSIKFKEDAPALMAVTNEYNCSNNFTKSLKKGESFTFYIITALCSSVHYEDYKNEAIRFNIFAYKEGIEKLITRHREDWSTLWQSDIQIESKNSHEQLDIRFSLYNLYSYIAPNTAYSIPPMGLYSAGYSGHIFWDAELWMFPPLLLLQPEMAKSMLEYRYQHLQAAKNNAFARGFKGAMFPWESASSGYEETPVWALTGPFQHHITADVGIAFWNYYVVTKDKQWLRERGFPVLKEVADFWISRVEKNDNDEYEIRNVVCSDEFAENKDNNAFTNAAAITALRYAAFAAEALELIPNPQWRIVASKIPVRKFPDGITREHETYTGETIKQADVNLLAFPLNFINDEEQIRKDLDYYSKKVTENGPAMTHGVYSVIANRINNCDKAYQYFQDSYIPNKRGPFGVLAESQKSDNPYFATGAGAMLQAVLFGFGGLDFDSDSSITQRTSCLPEPWTKLTLTGIGPMKKTFVVKK